MAEKTEQKTLAEQLAERGLTSEVSPGREAAQTPSRLTFGERLRSEREKAKRTVWDLARGLSVPKDRYRAFEDGEASPTRAEYARLCKQLRSMRFHEPEPVAEPSSVRAGRMPEVVHLRAPRVDPLPEPKHQPRAKTFGEALKAERLLEEVEKSVVAECLDVSDRVVDQWEADRGGMLQKNYDRLVELFPRLAQAPPPVRLKGPSAASSLAGAEVTARIDVAAPSVALVYDSPRLVSEKVRKEMEESVLAEAERMKEDVDADIVRDVDGQSRAFRRHPVVRRAVEQLRPAAPPPPPKRDPMIEDEKRNAPPPASAETLTERAIGMLEALRGGEWELSYRRAESRPDHFVVVARSDDGSKAGPQEFSAEGEGTRGACRALLRELSAEVDRESSSLRQQAEKTAAELRRRASALDALKGRD